MRPVDRAEDQFSGLGDAAIRFGVDFRDGDRPTVRNRAAAWETDMDFLTRRHSLLGNLHAYSLLRIVFGFLFSCHGLSENIPVCSAVLGGHGRKSDVPLIGLVLQGSLELVGLLVLVGLFTRIISFILSGEMAMAYFVVHFPHGFWPIKNGGERAVIYCFLLLYFCGRRSGNV